MSEKSRTVTFLLAFFLGMFGIHRFYAGKNASGAIQLILSISIIGTIVSSFWVLADWIFILAGEFTDGENKKIVKW